MDDASGAQKLLHSLTGVLTTLITVEVLTLEVHRCCSHKGPVVRSTTPMEQLHTDMCRPFPFMNGLVVLFLMQMAHGESYLVVGMMPFTLSIVCR
jgi:hypothetical protein